MKPSFIFLIAAALVPVFAQPNPPDEAAQKKILADTAAKAMAYAKELPDFTCRQVTRRNEDPKGTNQWRIAETINEQLGFIHGKEEYRTITVNGKKSDRASDVARLSDFANYLKWVFDPKAKAELSWSQWDTLRGHRVHVIGFRVRPENSQWVISRGKGQTATAGIFGLASVDSESGAILKLGLISTDIPTTFPVQGSMIEAQYEFAQIGDHYYVVPLKADLHAKEGKMLIWNEVEFHDYRKPGVAESAGSK